ncbi:MAG: peroxiredoxin family protein, partial [Limnobacter sp.]|nr:peroxiredoxin family protein [Limnobacter sp.]
MIRAKSIFITLHVLLVNLALIHIAVVSWMEPLTSGWLGVFVIALPNLYFFVWLFMGRVARTSRNMHLITAMNLLGYAMVLTDANMDAQPIPLVWGTVLLISSLLYIHWYSHLGARENGLLEVGQKLPAFDLTDLQGNQVKSSHFNGQPYLLMFYRGNWCPLCMAQIREVAADYLELDRFGVKVALISPQPEKQTKALAERFEVPFEFYVDSDLKASKKLKIDAEKGLPFGFELLGYDSDTVLPTVLMINKNGRIIYSDQTSNYRV